MAALQQCANMPATRVYLLGGLGNQLFQLAEGVRLAQTRSVIADYSLVDIMRPHGEPVRESVPLGLGLCVARSRSTQSFNWIRGRSIAAIARRKWLNPLRKVLSIRIDADTGASFDLDSRSRVHYGYWQNTVKPATLCDMRRVLLQAYLRPDCDVSTALGTRPEIAVQVRRGDYRLNSHVKKHHGLLHDDYFVQVIKKIRLTNKELPVRIYSDEPNQVEQLGRRIGNVEIEATAESAPMQDLIKISTAAIIVVSNSSFGWWAAAIAGSSAERYLPSQWYRDAKIQSPGIVSNWSYMQPIWAV